LAYHDRAIGKSRATVSTAKRLRIGEGEARTLRRRRAYASRGVRSRWTEMVKGPKGQDGEGVRRQVDQTTSRPIDKMTIPRGEGALTAPLKILARIRLFSAFVLSLGETSRSKRQVYEVAYIIWSSARQRASYSASERLRDKAGYPPGDFNLGFAAITELFLQLHQPGGCSWAFSAWGFPQGNLCLIRAKRHRRPTSLVEQAYQVQRGHVKPARSQRVRVKGEKVGTDGPVPPVCRL
jgi:hypothetical protein